MNPDDLRSALYVLADRVGDDPAPDLVPRVRALATRRRRVRQGLGAAAAVVVLAVGALGLHALDGGSQASLTPIAPPSTAPAPPGPGTGLSPRPAPGQVDNLVVTPTLKPALVDAYYRAYLQPPSGTSAVQGFHRSDVITPTHVYYGVRWGATPAADTFYAIGYSGMRPDPISQQDGPDVWSKQGTGAWRFLGDTGGSVPCGKVPKPLLIVWGFPNADTASYCH